VRELGRAGRDWGETKATFEAADHWMGVEEPAGAHQCVSVFIPEAASSHSSAAANAHGEGMRNRSLARCVVGAVTHRGTVQERPILAASDTRTLDSIPSTERQFLFC
jgi:hypothetical protein